MKCNSCDKIIPKESIYCMYCGAKISQNIEGDPDFIETKIKKIIEPHLKSPASAVYNINLKDEDKYGRKFYDVIVDSQNSYGAMLRTEYFIIFYKIDYDKQNTYQTDDCLRMKTFFMSEDAMKRLHNWGKKR